MISHLQYIPRNMHTVFALLCFVVVIHWLIFPYPSGLLHWLYGNLTIAPVPAKQPWWIWINTSCEFIMDDSMTTTKQSTTKPCAYFLGYTVGGVRNHGTALIFSMALIIEEERSQCNDITQTSWHIKTATWPFIQQFVQVSIKEFTWYPKIHNKSRKKCYIIHWQYGPICWCRN